MPSPPAGADWSVWIQRPAWNASTRSPPGKLISMGPSCPGAAALPDAIASNHSRFLAARRRPRRAGGRRLRSFRRPLRWRPAPGRYFGGWGGLFGGCGGGGCGFGQRGCPLIPQGWGGMGLQFFWIVGEWPELARRQIDLLRHTARRVREPESRAPRRLFMTLSFSFRAHRSRRICVFSMSQTNQFRFGRLGRRAARGEESRDSVESSRRFAARAGPVPSSRHARARRGPRRRARGP